MKTNLTCFWKLTDASNPTRTCGESSNFGGKTKNASLKYLRAISNNNGKQIVAYVFTEFGKIVDSGWVSDCPVLNNQIN